MTVSLINVAVEQFRADFQNVYQQLQPMLPPTVVQMRNVVGTALHTKVAGRFVLHDRGAFQSDIPPTDVAYTDVVLTFLDKIANLPSDIFEQATVNASERINLAKSSAWSISRQQDQIIINALNAATGTGTIAAGGTNLTVDKLREAKSILDIQNVPKQNRVAVIHANSLKSLLEQTEVTSSDFNTIRALVMGEIDTYLGFRFIDFGDLDEGGLPLAASIRTTFFYQQDSMLAAWGVLSRTSNPGIEVSFDNRSQSWLVIPKLRMGAKDILPAGIVKVDCDES